MEKTKRKFRLKPAVLVFIVLFIILYAIIYIVPRVTDIFTQTYTAEYGTLETSIPATCVIVRDEQLYRASVGGSVERARQAGELVRKNSLVATVGGTEHYTDSRGIVSYYYDGYEEELSSQTLAQLGESFLNEYESALSENGGEQEAAAGEAAGGDVIFKIVDNKQWFLVCWLSPEDAELFEQGNRVQAAYDEQEPVLMSVFSKTQQGEKYQIVLSCDRSYANFDRYRLRECRLITSSYSGILLETDSIAEEDGVKGVYVINKLGDAVFTPVSILSSYQGQTVVEKNYFYDSEGEYVETVENYDEILKG